MKVNIRYGIEKYYKYAHLVLPGHLLLFLLVEEGILDKCGCIPDPVDQQAIELSTFLQQQCIMCGVAGRVAREYRYCTLINYAHEY